MRLRAIAGVVALLAAVTPAAAQQTFDSDAGRFVVTTKVGGLAHPWALAFLPDGRLLITERPGRLRIATQDGKLLPPVAGVPQVYAARQGGLLDVIVDHQFNANQTVYFCFAEPVQGGSRTALARARLIDGEPPRLENVEVIFGQKGPPSSGAHYGCRIVQTADGDLFLTMGDHFSDRDLAQTLDNHIGKIVRIKPDGSVPPDNPLTGLKGALPETWSYGHRNVQGLAINPDSGTPWAHEHGPRGGDEVNVIRAGKNYGWPVIGYGVNYDGSKAHEATAKTGMEQPIKYWVPSIAPSGMAFYTGDLFPAWKGSLFVGALAGQMLVRLSLDGEKVVAEERLLRNYGERIRDVRQGPDGALWLVTDNAAGRVLRVAPAE